MEEKIIRPYEISYLLTIEEDVEVIVNLLSEFGAEIVNEGTINEIRLAYPIKKRTRAYFGYIQFNIEPSRIKKLHDSLELNDKIIRFLIITPPFLKGQTVNKRRPQELKPRKQEAAPKSELSNVDLEEKLEEIKI